MLVANARGTRLPFSDPLSITYEVLRNTANNSSSMLRDVQRGVKTEIEYINGAIVREGEKLGVDVDFNRRIVSLLEHPQARALLLNEYMKTSSTHSDYLYL